MGEGTKIAWCDDTYNPWHGCTKVSPGCVGCYAETLVMNRMGGGPYRKGIPRVRHAQATFNAPLRWNKKPWVCDECGQSFIAKIAHDCIGSMTVSIQSFHRRRVFSLSLGDWLDEEVPIEWLADMLDVIRHCPDLDFLLLTKRPQNWQDRMMRSWDFAHTANGNRQGLRDWIGAWQGMQAPPNVWIGTSVEDQQRADERIPELLKIPAAIRFLSAEPLLGPIELDRISAKCNWEHMGRMAVKNQWPGLYDLRGISWVIFGGESHQDPKKARPCNMAWIEDGVKQCKAAGVAAFVKQLGSRPIDPGILGNDWPIVLKDKKGGDWLEWPEDLRVRQWPKNKPSQPTEPGLVSQPKEQDERR